MELAESTDSNYYSGQHIFTISVEHSESSRMSMDLYADGIHVYDIARNLSRVYPNTAVGIRCMERIKVTFVNGEPTTEVRKLVDFYSNLTDVQIASSMIMVKSGVWI